MNIDSLTIGQVRELTAMLNGSVAKTSPFVGRYVIIRTYSAGVHAGELVSQDGDIVVLKGARRL
jgi:hypothetical protein